MVFQDHKLMTLIVDRVEIYLDYGGKQSRVCMHEEKTGCFLSLSFEEFKYEVFHSEEEAVGRLGIELFS